MTISGRIAIDARVARVAVETAGNSTAESIHDTARGRRARLFRPASAIKSNQPGLILAWRAGTLSGRKCGSATRQQNSERGDRHSLEHVIYSVALKIRAAGHQRAEEAANVAASRLNSLTGVPRLRGETACWSGNRCGNCCSPSHLVPDP